MASNPTKGKSRSRLAAFFLNVVLPPAGYVYAGCTGIGILVMVCLLGSVVAAFFVSLAFPPGLFAVVGDLKVGAALVMLIIAGGLGAHAAWLASRPRFAEQSRLGFWISLLGLPLCFYALSLLWRAYFPIPTYVVASESGLPTLAKGDQVAVHGARARCGSLQPTPGALIVYKKGASSYMKRVIAGAGTSVAVRQGRLVLNGVPVETRTVGSAPIDPSMPGSVVGQIVTETLPNGASYQTLVAVGVPELDNFGPYKVPANSWFVLGDNRDNSLDSRADGAIQQSQVCGTVFKIVNSPVNGHIGQPLESSAYP